MKDPDLHQRDMNQVQANHGGGRGKDRKSARGDMRMRSCVERQAPEAYSPMGESYTHVLVGMMLEQGDLERLLI